jgi:hypothetical protein
MNAPSPLRAAVVNELVQRTIVLKQVVAYLPQRLCRYVRAVLELALKLGAFL